MGKLSNYANRRLLEYANRNEMKTTVYSFKSAIAQSSGGKGEGGEKRRGDCTLECSCIKRVVVVVVVVVDSVNGHYGKWPERVWTDDDAPMHNSCASIDRSANSVSRA